MRPSSRDWSRQWGLSWTRFNCLPEELIGQRGLFYPIASARLEGLPLSGFWCQSSLSAYDVYLALVSGSALTKNMQISECASMKILLLWKSLPEFSPGGLNTTLRSLSWIVVDEGAPDVLRLAEGLDLFILVSLLLVVDIHEGVGAPFVLGLTRRLELFYLRK